MKRKLDDMIEAKKTPRDIYEDMVLNGSDCASRDLKQVQNAKNQAERNKQVGKRHYRQNTADKIQTLISDIHTHPFIQEIVQTKRKPLPSYFISKKT